MEIFVVVLLQVMPIDENLSFARIVEAFEKIDAR